MSKFLGQHFLENDEATMKIVREIDAQAGETILEIGPGHGALTIPLSEAAQKAGAKIVAVEKDQKLAEALQLVASRGNMTHLEVIQGDILEFLQNPSLYIDKIAGNIPYYLTGKLLRIIGEMEAKPSRVILMIQKEVAERICAEPPRMNRLAASVQFWSKPKIIARIPRTDFSPPPEVDSAVIMLESIKDKEKDADGSLLYYAAVRGLFAQPRKMIINNLEGGGTDRKEALAVLEKLDIDPKSRPQDLSIEQIRKIAENIAFLGSVHK